VKKNAALLSFEDDEGGEEGDGDGGGGEAPAAARIRSAHEAIDDARCVYDILSSCGVDHLTDYEAGCFDRKRRLDEPYQCFWVWSRRCTAELQSVCHAIPGW
jgi:hypothetical protein